MITRHVVAQQLTQYLHGEIPLARLVHWGEEAMREGEFSEEDFETIREVVARIGLSDVAAFGLTWEDCSSMLARLGYRATVVVQ
jgi:hypothetical protein